MDETPSILEGKSVSHSLISTLSTPRPSSHPRHIPARDVLGNEYATLSINPKLKKWGGLPLSCRVEMQLPQMLPTASRHSSSSALPEPDYSPAPKYTRVSR